MKLTEIMKEKGISSKDLEQKTGIKKRTIDSYRQGTKSMGFKNGLAIADALGVDPHELLEEEE